MMINTEGPQRNLTIGDKIFLWFWIGVCAIFLSMYFGIVVGLVLVAIALLYVCFEGRIKKELRGRNMRGERIQKEVSQKGLVPDEELEELKSSEDPEDIRLNYALEALKKAKTKRRARQN